MDPDTPRRACQDCDYWDEKHAPYGVGQCRKTPGGHSERISGDAGCSIAVWRYTRKDDWCGEYVSRTLQLSTEGQALATVKGLAKELEALAYMTEVAASTLRSVTGKGATAQATHEAAKHATELARGYLG